MKTIRLLLIILFSFLLIVIVGVFVAYKTVDINKYRKEISTKISQAVGADVSMDKIALSFSIEKGVFLGIEGLAVIDPSSDEKKNIISVDEVSLNADILAFITKRKLIFSKINIISPTIRIVKELDGSMNLLGLRSDSPESKKQDQGKPSTNNLSVNDVKKEPFDMTVNSIVIKHGAVFFEDKTSSPELDLFVDNIDLDVDKFSLKDEFGFNFASSVFSDYQNISFSGKAKISQNNKLVRVNDIEFSSKLSKFDRKRMLNSFPAMGRFISEEGIKGTLKVKINQLICDNSGIKVLSSNVEMSDGSLPLKEPKLTLDNIDIKAEITESDINISEIFAYMGSGSIKARGRLVGYMKERDLSFSADIESVKAQELAKSYNLPVQFEGNIFGNLDLKGSLRDLNNINNSLYGEEYISVKDGKIVDFNALKLVLDKISFIPNLAQKVYDGLSDRYKARLKEKDTIIKKLSIDSRYREGYLYINDISAETDDFSFYTSGKMDLNGNIHLKKTSLVIPKELSEPMVDSAQELSYFLNDKGEIKIPFKDYSGGLNELKIYPDIDNIGKTILKNRGKQELKSVIFKALDIDENPQGTSEDNSSQAVPNEDTTNKKPEEAAIENVLDGLLNSVFK